MPFPKPNSKCSRTFANFSPTHMKFNKQFQLRKHQLSCMFSPCMKNSLFFTDSLCGNFQNCAAQLMWGMQSLTNISSWHGQHAFMPWQWVHLPVHFIFPYFYLSVRNFESNCQIQMDGRKLDPRGVHSNKKGGHRCSKYQNNNQMSPDWL